MEFDPVNSNGHCPPCPAPLAQLPLQVQLTEVQLAAAVENMTEAFFALDLTGCCTYLNRTAERLFGIDRSLLIHKPLWDILQVDATSQLYQQHQQVVIDQSPAEFEEFYLPLNRWFTVRFLPTPGSVYVYLQDITKRKQTEAALRKEQEFLNVLLDNVQAGIVACDAEGQLKLFNRAARSFHGLSEQPVPPEQWASQYDLYLPDGKTLMQTEDVPLYQAFQGHRVENVEMMIIPKQGTARLLLASGQAVYNSEGEKQAAVVVMHDITERKQIETALQEREIQLTSIFQTIPDGIVIVDQQGQIVNANRAAEQILRLTRSVLAERSYNDPSWLITTVDGDPFPDEELPFVQVMRTQKPVYGVEHAITHADGTKTILSINASPLFNTEGCITHVITVVSDITARKQAEAERARLIQEQTARTLAETAQSRSAFLAEVSELLASSLDYEQTLQSVAQLAVPHFADWCSVDLLNDDGTISRVAVAHCDPDKVQFGWEMAQRFPRHLDDGYGISEVMKTGQSEIALEITDEQLAAISNPEYLEILQGLGLKSCIVAPLEAHGKVLGSISFVFAESQRHYCMDDLELAEDLAHRAAIAIDNAHLYHTAQRAKHAAEIAADRTARLQIVTAALSESLTPEQVSAVIVEQSMAVLEATAALVVLVSQDRTELEIVQSVGYQADLVESWRKFSINADVPLAAAIRTGEPVWVENLLERIARYPHLAEVYGRYDFQSWIALPLVVEGRSVGGMLLSFKEFKQLSQDDREFILALSRQCAQAIFRAQLYEAERNARAEAEQANRIKDEFLAVLSHELRSPLNPILGWTRILRTQPLQPDKVDRALETIERNAKLQAQLIEDLLDISRMLRGKLSLNSAPVDLITVIHAAIETVQLAASAKFIQIQTNLQPTEMILGDANRLQQVIWNLLSNAIKFTPNEGQVELRLEQVFEDREDREVLSSSSCAYAQITIRDNGLGINPDFLPHVFDYFRQADSSTTRNFGGLGLGLAIARQIVELHGGTIWADSPGEGLGAIFTVKLPLGKREQVKALDCDDFHSSLPSPHLPLAGLKILVVDDEADMRDLAEFILSQHGAQVTIASSATEAIAALTQFVPDALLCDIGMPEMDGYALMRQIRGWLPERGGTVPAIALTAYAGEYNQQQALKAGFQQHVTKPVEPEALVRAISTLCNHYCAGLEEG